MCPSDEQVVKFAYPQAQCVAESGVFKTDLFTILDYESHTFIGPTAFTEENAWRWAAERIRKQKAGADEAILGNP